MSLKLPQIVGHRGVAQYAPENTLEGFHMAADMGVEWVEFDVKLTKDGIPILFHDDELDRTTNGSGKVAEMDYDEIQEFEAGSWFSDGYSGIKIPTLEEAIDVFLERDLGINAEIKPCPGREIETTETTLDILSRVWDDHDRILISSFEYSCLEAAKDIANDWARGLLFDEVPENWSEIADYISPKTININGNSTNITREMLESFIDNDYGIMAYTINDPLRARELIAWGVDSIFSDAPDIIKEGILTIH